MVSRDFGPNLQDLFFDNWLQVSPVILLYQNMFILSQKCVNQLLSTINLRVSTTLKEIPTIEKEKVILTAL